MDKVKVFNPSQIRHSGNSMYPSIKDNDLLDISFFDQPKNLIEFSEGDVVFLRLGNEWVVHRVVKKQDQLLTMGDWSLCTDETSSVWGRVERVEGSRRFVPRDPYLSQLSVSKINKNRILRLGIRIKLLAYVYWKTFMRTFFDD